MSILPNYLLTGALVFVLGIAATVWTVCYLQTRRGGWILLGISVLLLLFGGGFFPPVIGMIGGLAGTQIHRPVGGQPGGLTRAAARLWPWPLVLLVGWLLALFPLGFFFNDALQEVMIYGALLILALLPLAVYSGYASDAARGAG